MKLTEIATEWYDLCALVASFTSLCLCTSLTSTTQHFCEFLWAGSPNVTEFSGVWAGRKEIGPGDGGDTDTTSCWYTGNMSCK